MLSPWAAMMIPVSIAAAPIRDADGEIVGVSAVHRDVTERRQAFENAQRMAAIVKGSDDAIIASTLDGVIISWNKGRQTAVRLLRRGDHRHLRLGPESEGSARRSDRRRTQPLLDRSTAWSVVDIAVARVLADVGTSCVVNAPKLRQQEQLSEQLQGVR